MKAFLEKKDIQFTVKRYVQEALSAMALGLFASLLVGLILKTLGEQWAILFDMDGEHWFIAFLVGAGTMAMSMMGPAIGVAVAWGLKAPPLVLFASAVTGYMGAQLGGPAGAFIAVALGVEFGKAVSKETKLDIILTPGVTLLVGAVVATFVGPFVGKMMEGLGDIIVEATRWQPFFFGIFIAVLVGLTLTAPISSAALCIMMDLSGLAAGAATVGCCAQMVGFAVISFKDNGLGGVIAQGLGTSMLQIANIVRNPYILIPPTLAAALLGPLSTCIFAMTNQAVGAGMGTAGLVGQIGTFTSMGFSLSVLLKIFLLHLAAPALLSWIFYKGLMKLGKIKAGDLKLNLG